MQHRAIPGAVGPCGLDPEIAEIRLQHLAQHVGLFLIEWEVHAGLKCNPCTGHAARCFGLAGSLQRRVCMRFAKILCPTDFSPGSAQAIRVAARIARETSAELVLVHAWYMAPTPFAGEYGPPPHLVDGIVQDAQRSLAAAARDATAGGAERVTTKLVTGVPWAEITALLENDAYDLCVIGTHGRTGLSRILLGSVAEKVVRHAPCSVLAVRPDGEARPFAHVLVPTDFSDSAEHALDLAARVVRPDGAITLLHVLELPIDYPGGVPDADFSADLDQRVARALATSATRVEGKAKITTTSRIGRPGAETLAFLDADPSIDLVVMGSHGRTGIKRALMGSVAEKIVRHARCPVLVARERVTS